MISAATAQEISRAKVNDIRATKNYIELMYAVEGVITSGARLGIRKFEIKMGEEGVDFYEEVSRELESWGFKTFPKYSQDKLVISF